MNPFREEPSERVEEAASPGQVNRKKKTDAVNPFALEKSDKRRSVNVEEARRTGRSRTLSPEEVRQLGVYETPDPNWYSKAPHLPGPLFFSGGGNPFAEEPSAAPAALPPAGANPFVEESSGAAMPGAPPQTLLGGFSQGVKRGLRHDTALAKGAIGLGLSGMGFESGNEWLDEAIADQQRVETATPRAVPSFSDIGGVGDAAMYAAETLGEGVPTLLGLVATGGVGGAALKFGGRKLVEKGIENRLTKLLTEKGVHLATGGAAIGLETGASAVEQKAATGEVSIPLALGAGTVKGVLETVVPLGLSKTLGITDDLAKGLVSRIASGLQGAGRGRILKGIATGTVAEGATETLQEAVDIAVRGYVDKNYDALGPAAAERLINAGIGGALVGGVVSGGVSAVAGEIAPDAPVSIEQLREARDQLKRVDQKLPEATISDVPEEEQSLEFKRVPAGKGPQLIPPLSPVGVDAKGRPEDLAKVGMRAGINETAPSPPAPSGMTRIYRMQNKSGVKIANIPDWIKESDDFKATMNATGRWFTDDINEASWYSREYPDGELVYVDIPTVEVEASRVSNIKPEGTDRPAHFSRRPEKELFIAHAAAKKAQPFVPTATATNLNAATPGSDPRDVELGFELLPTAYNTIPARDEVDLVRAPLELAVNKMMGERDAVKAQEQVYNAQQKAAKRDSTSEITVGFKKDESGKVDAAINSLLSAGAYARKDRVPTILEGITEGENLVESPQAAALVQQQLPPGFSVVSVGRVMLNLKSPEGRTILQVPNKDWTLPIMQTVAASDRELWTSGFYNIGATNIQKMRDMGMNDVFDTRHISTVPVKETVNVLKKLGYHKMNAALNMNVVPTPRTKINLNESSLIADTVKFTRFMSWWNTLLQIAQRNPNYIPLQQYVGAVQSEQARQMHILSEANDTIKLGQRVGKEQLDAASDFLWDLENQVYKQDPDAPDRWPTEMEEAALIKKHNIRRETYRMISQMRAQATKHFNVYIAEMQQEALKITAKDGQNPLAAMRIRATQLKNIERWKKAYFSRPRFQFVNLGEFVVEVRDLSGELIAARLHETKGDQAATANELKRKYPSDQGYKIKTTKVPLTVKQWLTAPDVALRALMQGGFLGSLSQEQKNLVIFLARSNPGMRKRFIHAASRRYGRGVDLLRAFAHSSTATAANMFKMRVVPKLNQTLAQMDRDRQAVSGTNDLADMITFLRQHMHDLLNPEADASRIRSLAFMWHISFVPASALVNATQVPLTTLPYLGTRFGNIKTMLALQKAYTSFNTFYSAGRLEKRDDVKSKLQARGIRDAVLDQSFATELAGLSEGTHLSRMLPGNRFDQTMATFNYYGGFMFQTVEKMNRNITFNAAVDLARANPQTKYLKDLEYQNKQTFDELLAEGFTEADARAYLAGRDAVNRTQFEYARWNRPKFMKGKIKGTIFTFWLFTQGMLNFGRRSPGALKYWFTMLAVAGLMGLPGGEDLKDIIRAASQWWFGTDFDVELEARRYIAVLVNPWLKEKDVPDLMRALGLKTEGNLQVSADLFLHGLSQNSFGLPNMAEAVGLPYVPSVDMSGSLSMGKLAPIDMTVFRPGLDWNMRVTKTVERLAGAALGPSVGMINGLFDSKLPSDDFKVWERAMPRILRSFLRAGRLGAEGEERTRTGSPVLEFDPMDPMHNAELWGMALGFQPTRLSKAWDEEIAKREVVLYWNTSKEIILNQYWHAKHVMNDKVGTRDVKKAIERYNNAVPWKQKRITSETIQRSMRTRLSNRRKAEKGLPVQKSDLPAWREVEQMFAE